MMDLASRRVVGLNLRNPSAHLIIQLSSPRLPRLSTSISGEGIDGKGAHRSVSVSGDGGEGEGGVF